MLMPHRRRTSPWAVSSVPCDPRSSNRTPSVASMSDIVLEMAGWEIPSFAAALVMLPLSAIAMRTRRSRNLIRLPALVNRSMMGGLNLEVTGTSSFSVYQIRGSPARLAMREQDNRRPHDDQARISVAGAWRGPWVRLCQLPVHVAGPDQPERGAFTGWIWRRWRNR